MSNLNNEIIIRSATLEDAGNLAVLKQQVWVATYAVEGIGKEYSDYLLKTFTLNNEISILNDPDFYTKVVEIDNHLIACIKIGYSSICPVLACGNGPEISVLYVLERYTGLGLGKLMLENIFLTLMELGYNSVWLSAYHKNERAFRFYKKFGFKEIGTTYFEMEGNKYENVVLEYLFQVSSSKINLSSVKNIGS